MSSASASQNWKKIRLKYAAPLRTDRIAGSADSDEYVGLENLQSWTGGFVSTANPEVDKNLPVESSSGTTSVFYCGDVLFGKLRPYLAKVWLADRNGVCTTELLPLQPAPEFDGPFLKYTLLNATFINLVESSTFGAKMPRANWEFIGGIDVFVPPIETQRRISRYVDRELFHIDALVAEKERMLAILEEKRTALISQAVTRGLNPKAPTKPSGFDWLGEVPAHWHLQRLKQLAEVRGGLTLGKRYTGALLAYPYIRVANVQDGYLKLDNVLKVEVPASEVESNLLANGDVLMNEGGDIDKLGRGCVWREQIKQCLHQNHVFAVRPHSVESDWLALWTSTLEAKRYFESRAKRSTNLASISGTNIKELPIPLPPVDERRKIQDFVISSTTQIEKLSTELRTSLKLLSERRSALITAAVTGQIPLDEMAI